MIYEKKLSDKIIGCALEVYNHLEHGYLEKVYENSMLIELNLHTIMDLTRCLSVANKREYI